MGLKIWLPLNGDVHNQGYSNITVENLGASVSSNGKIGQCYAFNGSSTNYLRLPAILNNTDEFSIAFWVKNTATNVNYCYYSQRVEANATGFSIFYLNGQGIRFDEGTSLQSSQTFPAGTWHHVVCCRDSAKKYIYIDGVLLISGNKTNTTAGKVNANYSLIGGSQNNTTGNTPQTNANLFNGSLNDYRIYDHCLSAAEVKEISQGLVLHYKLDSFNGGYGNPNLCKNSRTFGTGWSGSGTVTQNAFNGFAIKYKDNTNGSSSTDTVVYNSVLTVNPNDMYTVSFWAKADTAHNITCYFYNNASGVVDVGMTIASTGTINTMKDGNITISLTTEWKYYWIRWEFKNTGTAAAKHLLLGRNPAKASGISIAMVKLERGDSATPWAPHPDDNEAVNTIIQDSSGYNHNGTITGNITLNTITHRYSISSSFNGTERITATTPGADIRTLSCWCKTTKNKSTSQHMVADSFSNMCISFYQGTIIGVFGTTRSTGSKSTLGDSYKENDWNHIVVVKTDDAGARDIYCNGVKLTPASNDYWNSAAGFFIGARNTSNGNPFYGQISDVRAYVTPLDADAIRQLYEVGAKIDNKENLHTFEIIEPSLQKITKQGQIKGQNLLETYLPLYDKTLYTEPDGSTWIHIFHHNNPAASKFNETTLDWTTGKYLDTDRWYDVDQAIYSTLGPYEFMVKQKTTNTAAEVKYRWTQTINPLTAVWEDVKPGQVTFNTTTGYTNSSYGGMYIFKTTGLHMCIANSSKGNWYGGIGAANAYNGGIPGFPNTTVTTGSIDLYIRIYNGAKIIKDIGVNSNEFIEI